MLCWLMIYCSLSVPASKTTYRPPPHTLAPKVSNPRATNPKQRLSSPVRFFKITATASSLSTHPPPQKAKFPSVSQFAGNSPLRSNQTSIPRYQHFSVNGNVIGMEGQGVDKVGKGTWGGFARGTPPDVFFGGAIVCMSVRDSQRGFKWDKIHWIERFGCGFLLNGRLASGFMVIQWFIVTGNTETDDKRQGKRGNRVDRGKVAQKFRWILAIWIRACVGT